MSLKASQQQAQLPHQTAVDVVHGPLETMLPGDVAVRLGVTEGCLAKWRMVGKGPPFIRVSYRRVVYPVSEFNAFLARRTRHTTLDAHALGA